MRWIMALAMLMLATPVFAQQNDAEKLYREFEKKLTATKAFKVAFDFDADEGPGKVKFRGELTLAAGNKMKLTFEGAAGNNPLSATVISDGKQMRMQFSGGGKNDSKNEAVPDQFSTLLAGFSARAGLFMGLEWSMPPRQPQALDKVTTAGFKLGVKEKVGDKEAQVVEYTLDMGDKDGGKGPLKCKVWFDVKTKMPLKRVLEVGKGGGMPAMVVELYSNWQLDAKARDGDFMLPK